MRNSSATPFMLSGGSGVHYLSHGSLELTCFLTSLVYMNKASGEATILF